MVMFKQECPVCYDIKMCIKLDCSHKFCKSCLKSSMQHFNCDMNNYFMCPYCRQEVIKIKNKRLNNILSHLKLYIKYRKMGFYMFYGTGVETVTCIYWFPSDPNIHNYPKKMRFYTYEEMI